MVLNTILMHRGWFFMALTLCVACWVQAVEGDVVISVYQGVCQEGDFAANLATVRRVVKEAKDRGMKLCVHNHEGPMRYGAKEWLGDRMAPNQAYSPTTDQPALTQLFDVQMARRTSSFDKFYREVTTLLKTLMRG